MTQQEETVMVRKEGLKTVLNGGSRIMESATLPIQWFFSKDVAEQEPKWVLVLIQDEKTLSSGFSGRVASGDRYYFHVTDRVGFTQLFRHGKHRVTIAVLEDRDEPRWFVRKDRNTYRSWFDPDDLGKITYIEGEKILAYSIEEIDVPSELFAKRSTSWLAQAMWKWVNRWHETEPRDQCQYRARAILAFTAQPVVVGIAYLLRYLFAFVGTLFLLFGRLTIFYFGYRPLVFEGIGKLWNYNQPIRFLHWDFRRFNGYLSDTHRVWGHRTDKESDWPSRWRKEDTILMPVAPWQVTLLPTVAIIILGSLCFAIWDLIQFFIANELTSVFWILGALIASIVIVRSAKRLIPVTWSRSFREWREYRRTAKREMRAKRSAEQHNSYSSWLSTELAEERAPKKVDLHSLPKPFKNTIAHTARVKFWAAKVAVCRPFSRS